MNVVSPANPFEVLWRMGYTRLCPITPPGCAVHPESTIARKIAKGVDARGKAPGVLRGDSWVGYPFLERATRESDLEEWRSMGGGVGILTGEGIVAIDADCQRPTDAETARAEILRLGALPERIGRAPKALYVCRTDPDFRYARLDFGEGERVEILAEGRQFVAHGTHPGTLQPYRWVRKLVPLDELPHVAPAALLGLLETLRARLPAAREIIQSGGGTPPDQESLRGNPDLVARAVESTPNTSSAFPTRESYLEYGYAIKAALPDDPPRAFDLFSAWCSRWDDGENEPETVESDWRRMRPPFRRGASWLYELAEKASPARFSRATAWHEELPPAEPEQPSYESIFRDDDEPEEEELESVSASTLDGLTVPAQAWLVEGMIPARNVTLLYGDGGTGKSLASLQLCFARATGTPWLGREAGRGRSLFITAEDELDELHRRLAAIASGTGLFFSDLGDLHLVSLVGRDAVLAAPDPRTGLMNATTLYRHLQGLLARLRPGVLVLDTLADLFGGDEIKRIQARQFIRLMHALTLGLDFDLTVILLAHPSVAGMNSGTGTSGNTAWSNSVRSRLYLERRFVTRGDKKVEPDADIRVLSSKKANRARQGAEILLRWQAGRFEPVSLEEAQSALQALADDEAFMLVFDEFAAAGRRVSDNPMSPTYAPRMFESHTKALPRERMVSAMTRLFGQSVIRVVSHGSSGRVRNHIERAIIASSELFVASSEE